MKRSSLALSVFGVSLLGCLAFGSTASATVNGGWGPDPCVIVYDYCILVDGNTEAYCQAKYQECLGSGQAAPQNRLHAKNSMPASKPDAGSPRG